jgi:hypothetical protein
MDVDDGPSHSAIGPASEERLRLAQLRRGARPQTPIVLLRLLTMYQKFEHRFYLAK